MRQNRGNVSDNSSKIRIWSAGVVIGMSIIAVLFLVFAVFVIKMQLHDNFVTSFAILALSFGSFFNAFYCGFKFHSRGISVGITSGMIFFTIIAIAGIVIPNSDPGGLLPVKLIFCLFAALIGGIAGVNKKPSRG